MKIDFDKAYDWGDWSFILEMMACLGFCPKCVAMVNTLFTNASTFVSINNSLSSWISLHRSIQQGCPLAPYLYVLTIDALGYLLEVARIQGKVQNICLPNGSKMVNNHFANHSLLLVSVERCSMNGALAWLNTFYPTLGFVVSNRKTDFWLVGLESLPNWIPAT